MSFEIHLDCFAYGPKLGSNHMNIFSSAVFSPPCLFLSAQVHNLVSCLVTEASCHISSSPVNQTRGSSPFFAIRICQKGLTFTLHIRFYIKIIMKKKCNNVQKVVLVSNHQSCKAVSNITDLLQEKEFVLSALLQPATMQAFISKDLPFFTDMQNLQLA